MRNYVDQETVALPGEVRTAIEKMLGRNLDADERVAIRAYRAQPVPSGAERKKAAQRLNSVLEKTSRKAASIPAAELETLIDELCDEVRHGSR